MYVLAQQGSMSSLLSLWPILAVGAVFWFLVIRPQRTRQKERESMLQEVTVGAEVVTIGGLFGEVEAIDDEWVDLLVSEDVVLRYSRSAIGRLATAEDQATLEAFAGGESATDDPIDDDPLADDPLDDEFADDDHAGDPLAADGASDPVLGGPVDEGRDQAGREGQWPDGDASEAERRDG